MSKNTDLTKLDWYQAAKKVIEDSNDAFRVTVASGTEFEIGLDSTEDSVAIKYLTSSGDEMLLSSTSTGELLVLNSDGFKKAQIFTKNIQAVTSPQAIALEVSPVESGDFWVSTASTLTPDAALNSTKTANPVDILAKRIRLTTSAQIASGEIQVVVLLGS